MTEKPVSLSELEDVRDTLINWVQSNLSQQEREFIVSVKKGSPRYELLTFKNLKDFPALQWKLKNISQIEPDKRAVTLKKLANVLAIDADLIFENNDRVSN